MTPAALTAARTATASGSTATGSMVHPVRYCTLEAIDSIINQLKREIAERQQKICQLEQQRADMEASA